MNLRQASRRFIRWSVIGVLAGFFTILPPARAAEAMPGLVGVGTWATQAEFKDIKVTKGDQTVLASDFSKGLQGCQTVRGQWEVVDGVLRQTGDEEDARALIGDPGCGEYTLTLKARKLGGNEGFLILFGMPKADADIKSWWNIGGWGNTSHAIESPNVVKEQLPGRIETDRWYDIKVEISSKAIRTYLNDQLIQTAALSVTRSEFGHALIPDLVADPSVAEINGTFYFYATTDGTGKGLSTAGLPVVWKSKDFLNWSFSGSLFSSNYDAKYWAPSTPVYKDGHYYLFPTLDNRITAIVSDSPEGPFRTPDGKDLNKTSGWHHFPITAGNPIDAEVFRDDDGTYYMVWSQRYIGKLKPDFSGFDGDPQPIQTKRGGYSEGPFLRKRNGIYYYFYTLGGNENYQYAYMLSRSSPLGPWEAPEQDVIATTDREQGVYGPGHGCFFNPQGSPQWYFVYLEYGRSGTDRQVMADKMNFNDDGTIQPIHLTLEGVGALRSNPDYSTPNLALGKTATASSTQPDFRVPPIADPSLNRVESFSPTNALDGSNGSRWMAAANDANAWYQVDLGQVCSIKRTELYFVKPTAGHAYRLEYSPDGEDWYPYAMHPEVRVQSPHTDMKSVHARYLRVTILQGTPGLWEFRVY